MKAGAELVIVLQQHRRIFAFGIQSTHTGGQRLQIEASFSGSIVEPFRVRHMLQRMPWAHMRRRFYQRIADQRDHRFIVLPRQRYRAVQTAIARMRNQIATDSLPKQVKRMKTLLVFWYDERTSEFQGGRHFIVERGIEFEHLGEIHTAWAIFLAQTVGLAQTVSTNQCARRVVPYEKLYVAQVICVAIARLAAAFVVEPEDPLAFAGDIVLQQRDLRGAGVENGEMLEVEQPLCGGQRGDLADDALALAKRRQRQCLAC